MASTPFSPSTSFAEIDLQKLRTNARILKRLASPAALLAVVKANAYGHGAGRVATVLETEGIRQFMVATLSEALALRRNGLKATILVATPPHRHNIPVYLDFDLHASVVSSRSLKEVLDMSKNLGSLHVHLKVDSGMGRLGMTPDEARAAIPWLLECSTVRLEALWTHLATATNPDTRYATQQLAIARELFEEFNSHIPLFHAGNGGALLNLPDQVGRTPNEWVRAGGALLGLTPRPELQDKSGLKPVLSLKSRILQIKTVTKGTTLSYGREWTAPDTRRIATVGIGYGDGYPSRYDVEPEVLIGGKPYPIAGRICMDMLMVDLGPPSETNESIKDYDEVILFDASLHPLSRLASHSGKKAYEICCNIAERVERVYIDSHNLS